MVIPHSLLAPIGLLLLLAQGPSTVRDPIAPGQLAPTAHAPVSERASDLWLVPSGGDPEAKTIALYKPLVEGVRQYQQGNYEAALPLVSNPSLASTPLAPYARYYQGLSQLRSSRVSDARATLDALAGSKPEGHLSVASRVAAGEAAEAAGDHATAIRIYEEVAREKASVIEDVLSRLGRAALAAGDRAKAAEAFLRVYYEFPLTDAATTAASRLTTLQDQIRRTGYTLDLGRAQRLFGARRFAEAREAFQELQRLTSGADRELVDLRIAESDFHLKRYAAARDALRRFIDAGAHTAEARFFYASALRELDNEEQYIAVTRALANEFPATSWAEDALNELASHYIRTNEDELAAETFRELYDKYPAGQRAERAAWKWGWWTYKTGEYAETVRVFESAAARFPRSDYRPSYLYWSARAHSRLGDVSQESERLRLVYTDYANSYYGRLAERQLSRRAARTADGDAVVPAARQQPVVGDRDRVPNEPVIRLLLANGLYDDALNELRYVQRTSGSSPVVDATSAWAHHQKGELRRAITLMRRAYPQFLTASHQLPPEMLQVIFPLTYWDLIRKYSAQRDLDPYLVAALIAQESTFDPQIRSVANAWGLMQVVPATGRRLARSLGIRRFSTSMLTNPEMNVRLGTLYFSRLVNQFGGAHYALASYNAGENRVVRWKAERPGIEQDEFIDDIPFPETQNYVKRILGTAEDYRQLYGSGLLRPQPPVGAAAAATPVLASSNKAATKKPATTKKSTTKKPTTKKPSAKKSTKKAPSRKR